MRLALSAIFLGCSALAQMADPNSPASITTIDGSTIKATIVLALGSTPGSENYTLRIHADGPVTFFRYTVHFTMDDMPGTNRQTRGMRDGYVKRATDPSADTEVAITTGGKVKIYTIYVNETAPPIVRSRL